MTYDYLLLDRPRDGVCVVTLNRPEVRNALNLDMQMELDGALHQLQDDDDIRAVVLTGAGDAAFSAGYDIREMQEYDTDRLMQVQRRREPWIWYLANHPKPLIGAINGKAHGAGAIIATALDIRIGSPRSEFRYTAVRYGGANNTWQLPPVVGFAKAKEFLFTGRAISADEALRTGLLNHVVAEDQVLHTAVEIASEIAANPPEGVRWHKRLMHEALGRDYEGAYRAENDVMMGELKPRPPGELFSKFLSRTGK